MPHAPELKTLSRSSELLKAIAFQDANRSNVFRPGSGLYPQKSVLREGKCYDLANGFSSHSFSRGGFGYTVSQLC